MKVRYLLASLLAVMLLLGGVQFGQAQEPGEPGDIGDFTLQPAGGDVLGNVRAGFAYQGQLKKDGAPVNGRCDFQFSLYDRSSVTGAIQLGATETQLNVSVNDGLFTVILNYNDEFGPDAFNGQARTLGIKVRCPAGLGTYVDLTAQARHPLRAVPYASTLRPGARVIAPVAAGASGDVLTVANTGTGRGMQVNSQSDTALWVNSVSGTGIDVRSTSGTALSVGGTGKIVSVADSTLYLSHFTMVSKHGGPLLFAFTDAGAVEIYSDASMVGGLKVVMPVPAVGTLFGAQVYLKSLQVCYQVLGSTVPHLYINSTLMIKSDASGGLVYYLNDTTDRTSTTRECYTVTPATRVAMDGASFVEFHIFWPVVSTSADRVRIDTVKLTLTEKSAN